MLILICLICLAVFIWRIARDWWHCYHCTPGDPE